MRWASELQSGAVPQSLHEGISLPVNKQAFTVSSNPRPALPSVVLFYPKRKAVLTFDHVKGWLKGCRQRHFPRVRHRHRSKGWISGLRRGSTVAVRLGKPFVQRSARKFVRETRSATYLWRRQQARFGRALDLLSTHHRLQMGWRQGKERRKLGIPGKDGQHGRISRRRTNKFSRRAKPYGKPDLNCSTPSRNSLGSSSRPVAGYR